MRCFVIGHKIQLATLVDIIKQEIDEHSKKWRYSISRSYSWFLNTWSVDCVSKISYHYQILTYTLYSIIHKRNEIYSAASDLLNTNRNIYGINAREMTFIQNYISPPKLHLQSKVSQLLSSRSTDARSRGRMQHWY